MLATGHTNQASGERYIWGIRWRSESLAATIADNNQQAVAGPSIKIVIDTVLIGTYDIGRRVNTGNGFQNVVAELPQADKDRIVNLLTVGGAMQFITSNFTYSASLQGAQQGIQNLRACALEANHLNAVNKNSDEHSQSMD